MCRDAPEYYQAFQAIADLPREADQVIAILASCKKDRTLHLCQIARP